LEVTLLDFIIFVFATIGLTHILVDGSLFEPFRNFVQRFGPKKLYHLISCYQCLGFWVGLLIGYFLLGGGLVYTLAGGFTGSFISNWAAIYLNYLEAQSLIDLKE
jgi:hypothetical protein